MYGGVIGCTRFGLVVMDLMLLGFIMEVEFNSVVTYIQEVGFEKRQKVSGRGLDR